MRRLEMAGRAYRLAAGSGHIGVEVWCCDWLRVGLGWDGRLAFGLMDGDGDCWCGLEVVSWRGLFRSEFCPVPTRSEASPSIKLGMDS